MQGLAEDSCRKMYRRELHSRNHRVGPWETTSLSHFKPPHRSDRGPSMCSRTIIFLAITLLSTPKTYHRWNKICWGSMRQLNQGLYKCAKGMLRITSMLSYKPQMPSAVYRSPEVQAWSLQILHPEAIWIPSSLTLELPKNITARPTSTHSNSKRFCWLNKQPQIQSVSNSQTPSSAQTWTQMAPNTTNQAILASIFPGKSSNKLTSRSNLHKILTKPLLEET